MNNIYFTSDPHFNHKNIVRGESAWIKNTQETQNTRNFDTLEEHNQALVKSWNSIVKHNDILYCLGDWSFSGHESIKAFRNQLGCQNIHLILGNHDQHIEPVDSPYRGCFNSVQHVLQFDLKLGLSKTGYMGKQGFFLSHYSHQVWNKHNKGKIHLFGHSHGTLKGIGKSMDVGVDTNDLYPYHLDEILDIMKGKESHIIDHHNSKTN